MMKRENGKEVSLAVLSFLKSGFFAAVSGSFGMRL